MPKITEHGGPSHEKIDEEVEECPGSNSSTSDESIETSEKPNGMLRPSLARTTANP